MEQYRFNTRVGLVSDSLNFVKFIDTLPRDILLTQTEISVRLLGRPETIIDDYQWVQLALNVRRHSQYWRVKTFTHLKLMSVTAHVKDVTTHDIRVVLRAVGVEDL